MNNLISIIIPVYNVSKYLKECLESVLAQTYTEIEIICINDGSTDNSLEILKDFQQKDFRIQIFNQENQGVSTARNKGLKIAKGNYIGFVDADDRVFPEMYERLLENLIKYDADISHCGYEMLTPNGKKLFYGTGKLLVQNKKEALVSLLEGNLFEPSSCLKLYKKEIIKEVGYSPEIKFNEDLLFNAEAFKRAEKSVFHDVILYSYTYNIQSASRATKATEIQKHVLSAAKEVKNSLSDVLTPQEINRFYTGKLLTIFQELYAQKKSALSQEIRKELKNSNFEGLSSRQIFLKITLLYFPFLYKGIKKIYDKTIGRNKKWDV